MLCCAAAGAVYFSTAGAMTSNAAAGGRADTKQKLASIIDGFSSFDSEMKIGTRVGGLVG